MGRFRLCCRLRSNPHPPGNWSPRRPVFMPLRAFLWARRRPIRHSEYHRGTQATAKTVNPSSRICKTFGRRCTAACGGCQSVSAARCRANGSRIKLFWRLEPLERASDGRTTRPYRPSGPPRARRPPGSTGPSSLCGTEGARPQERAGDRPRRRCVSDWLQAPRPRPVNTPDPSKPHRPRAGRPSRAPGR